MSDVAAQAKAAIEAADEYARSTGVQVLVEALKEVGYGVVKLPKQCPPLPGWSPDCVGAWPVGDRDDPVSAWPDKRGPGWGGVAMPDGAFITAEKARALAAALLAAADAADGA